MFITSPVYRTDILLHSVKVLVESIERKLSYTHFLRFTYDESMKVESITSSVSSLALAFGEGSNEKVQMSRPFGVALLFAGVDKNGPR